MQPLGLVVLGAALLFAAGGCSQSQSPADEVVTAKSNGAAIRDPRRGSYKKSEPGTYGYYTPSDNAAAPVK
jgi:hypothetical protein